MIIFALIFLKFIFYLPLKFRTLFISSAAIYLLGAVGVEIMGAVYTETVYYQIVMPIEETLEMSGIIMFIYSLLSFKEMYGRPMLVNIRK